ncbi:actin-like protein, putative [Plasmodium knowlesi strain H]|uniref:Actin-like protein, putative n=3 Tax=Plasmodium knowlesi TaxID=5850 RepID=A0A5K1UD46_PLAKH|nr:actin-like protein, putative [Plasmodium knowlesi strain H]OTN66181.1 putative Actin-like protein [Plasmodium knowlesi]CAA9986394.1 actin-like protein, putative [Plasmodium knowlesi strain H]SBO25664.1 actin-like protein, putative [Plasmodium knowlesi strain H]SBO28379.1 actin-like protein, putative [Plasmodium knowlesi strain H]VVS75868.1 actin-like protein, putative [Plasmodium knowlesi strain H]|eukprot:XP_002257800.1 hypothetical protein, conserved in Plasmodium species [Plasmodium knowlesi strain H]
MESRFKKNDSENDYKYYVLQIGRKYTYLGFSGLHKPLSVYRTPDFFRYNESFHDYGKDKKGVYDMLRSVSEGVGTSFRGCASGYEDSSDQQGEGLNLDEGEKGAKPDPNEDTLDQNQRLNSICLNQPLPSMEGRKQEGSLIYHYEYKFHQDVKLWRNFFEEFTFHIFRKLIKTNNKAKKVIVLLNMFIPTIIKYSLCKTLIENYEYTSISYINDLVSPLFLCNCNTCVVIDLGYLSCRLLPVINGMPLYHHYTYVDNGGFYINMEIRRLLKEQYVRRARRRAMHDCEVSSASFVQVSNENILTNPQSTDNGYTATPHEEKPMEEEKGEKNTLEGLLNYYLDLYPLEEILNIIDIMPDDEIENIKMKYFYLKNEQGKLYTNKIVLYEFQNYQIIVEADTRWMACEILFTKDYEQNINSMFACILSKLHMFEFSAFHNVLLVGGCSNIKGIVSKIAQSLLNALSEKKKTSLKDLENRVNFLFPKISPNLRQFIGASICSNLENLPDYTQEHIHNNVLYDHLNEDVYFTFKH